MAVDSLIYSGSQACLPTGAVAGDIDPVTLFTFSTISAPLGLPAHGVLGRELMSLVTSSPVGFKVDAVGDEIKIVLGNCVVDDVFGNVLEFVPIVMRSDKSFGPWTVEDQSHELVNPEFPSVIGVVSVELDFGIPLVIDPGLKDLALLGLSERQNFPVSIDPVTAVAGDADPVISHGWSLYSTKPLVKEGISNGS